MLKIDFNLSQIELKIVLELITLHQQYFFAYLSLQCFLNIQKEYI